MTDGAEFFITKRNCRSYFGQNFMTGMTETPMPKRGGGDGGKGMSGRKVQGVERPRAIAPDDHSLRLQILHRTTSRVKFNRAIVVSSKLANRDKILNKFRRNENIIKR